MRKYAKYLFLVFPYIIAVVYFMLKYEEITIVTYLFTMIIPMITSGFIVGIACSKKMFGQKMNKLALLCTVIYFLFYIVIIVLMKKYKIYEFLYVNSKHLFVEGFSIGNKFSANIFDALLPCCICYCIHVLSIKYSNKQERKVKK